MSKVIRGISLASVTLCLVSCSAYVKKWRNSIEQEEKVDLGTMKNQRRQEGYSFHDLLRQRENLRAPASVGDTRSIRGRGQKAQRQYASGRRATVESLYDNKNEGSLWSMDGQENYLFSQNNSRRHGDIVVINVGRGLQAEINSELYRNYAHSFLRRDKKKSKKGKLVSTEKNKRVRKVYDKITGVIIEEVSRNRFVVRGKKYVSFKRERRLIEVEALIAERDIGSTDTVHSDNFLASQVTVLR